MNHLTPNATPDDRPADDAPSKSQRKRDMHALQKLGEKLVKLSTEKLALLALPELLLSAVLEAQRTRSHEGKRRQMQYIGKVMRQVDTALIEATLTGWEGQTASETGHFHALERQREELLASDTALTLYLQAHPTVDAQQLRTLIRHARKERAANTSEVHSEQGPPKHFRALFQALKQHTEQDFSQDLSAS